MRVTNTAKTGAAGAKQIVASDWKKILQPEDSYFELGGDMHGSSHTARVIIHAWLTAQRHAPELTPELIAAGFLHDLARRNDRECSEHGKWAVESHLGKWRKNFEAIGVKNFELVKDMVTKHCQLPQPSDSLGVTLFRQADNLDRVRMDDLDTAFLYDDDDEIITFAEDLVEAQTDRLDELFKTIPHALKLGLPAKAGIEF